MSRETPIFYVLLFFNAYWYPERFIHLTSMIPRFKILEGPFRGFLNFTRALGISDILNIILSKFEMFEFSRSKVGIAW